MAKKGYKAPKGTSESVKLHRVWLAKQLKRLKSEMRKPLDASAHARVYATMRKYESELARIKKGA